MHPLLSGVSIDGVCRPGEVYIFMASKSRSCHIDPLHFSYVIRSESEILPALEFEMGAWMDYYEFREFLSCRKISDDCHAFRFLCSDKPEMGETIFSLYLHRMMSLKDVLDGARKVALGE